MLDFNPQAEGEEAGLVVRGNDENHYVVGVARREGKRLVVCRCVKKGINVDEVRKFDIAEGPVELAVTALPDAYSFSVRDSDAKTHFLGAFSAQDLATEKIGGFTGAYIGMYATSDESLATPADFDWFDYHVTKR
jgi:alpha-N-arabinofuranosidase